MEEKQRILLCEDDENLGMLLREYLQAKGYYAELCPDGDAGYKAFLKGKFDLCVLDVMMPIKDGFTLAQEIRSVNPEIPIIFLTAKTLNEDILEGFKIGADDYITKPFSMEELIARLNATLRRSFDDNKPENSIFSIGNYTFDYNRQLLIINNEEQKLTAKESELLRMYCVNFNQLVERVTTLQKIWKDDSYFAARSMDVYITKLRKYLSKDPDIQLVNMHGIGFKLTSRTPSKR